jgi:ankyrin
MEDAIASNEISILYNSMLNSHVPVDPNIKNSSGQTGVILASQIGSTDVLDAFFAKNADLNAFDFKGYNAMHYSAEAGHVKFVKSLIEKKNVDQRAKTANEEQYTPLVLACMKGHSEVVDLLVDNLQDLRSAHGQNKDTPLHFAIRGRALSSFRKNASGFICRPEESESRIDVVEVILRKIFPDHHQLLSLKNAEGNIPLHESIRIGDFATTKMLLGNDYFGINDRNSHHDTPIHYATRFQRNDILKFLITSGKADINPVTKTGYTPLHEAAMIGNLESVKLLVDNGASINAINSYGKIPEDESRKRGIFGYDITEFLKEKRLSNGQLDP